MLFCKSFNTIVFLFFRYGLSDILLHVRKSWDRYNGAASDKYFALRISV